MSNDFTSDSGPSTKRYLRNTRNTPHFGVYPILDTLGEGAFGTVYLVMSSTPQLRILALKTMKSDDATTAEREAFKTEAGRWVSLGVHPNIVTAYDVHTPHGAVGVLCDFIPADEAGRTTLSDWIESSTITDELLVRWSLDFCAGMAHAYAHGLTAHRDIKPDNLLIDHGSLCVADFGLATAAQLLTQNATMRDLSPAGSRAFMPPEQFIPKFKCDQRSDIYAFGVTLYVAVTGGQHPIQPVNIHDHDAWIFAHARDAVRPLNHFLWPVIERCLRKRPERRFATIDELRAAVQQVAVRAGIHIEHKSEQKSTLEQEWLKLENQAHSLALLGYEQESMQLYDRAFALRDDPHLWQSKANALLALGRLEQALECVMTALERSDDGQAQWYILGDVLRKLDRHEHAVMAYEQALQKLHEHTQANADRIEAQIHHALSLSLRALGDFTRAQAEIGKAIALQPREVPYRRSKAELFMETSHYGNVLREVEAAEAYAANDPQLCHLRIHALVRIGREEEALRAAERSLAFAPDHPHHCFNYATALSAAYPDNTRRVITAFDKALALAEPYHELHSHVVSEYVNYLKHIGQHDQARQIMLTAAAERN
ncbi:MAG: serine/threonine-protein kinase [Chloroflexi bacterium]|nr:serine/threonine-protein kinase [Chloroflexota bacterium]